MRFRRKERGDHVELQLTSMIDIIFLLLAFFIMTFKIVAPEGDFNIKMPQAAPTQGDVDPDAQTVEVFLFADPSGNLRNIRFQQRSLGPNFQKLRAAMGDFIGDMAGPESLESIEVKITADYDLKYENTIEAVTAVTGRVEDGHVVKLVEKVRFTPPR